MYKKAAKCSAMLHCRSSPKEVCPLAVQLNTKPSFIRDHLMKPIKEQSSFASRNLHLNGLFFRKAPSLLFDRQEPYAAHSFGEDAIGPFSSEAMEQMLRTNKVGLMASWFTIIQHGKFQENWIRRRSSHRADKLFLTLAASIWYLILSSSSSDHECYRTSRVTKSCFSLSSYGPSRGS